MNFTKLLTNLVRDWKRTRHRSPFYRLWSPG